MRHLGASFAVLAALALPAFAAGWSSFDNTFPTLPCQDGWAGCLVDGAATGPGALKDAAGRPLPADARFGWFDLKPTVALSPFAGLSTYSGPVGGAVAAAVPVETTRPVTAPRPASGGDAVADARAASGSSAPATTSAPSDAPATAAITTTSTATATTSSGGMRPGAPSAQPTTTGSTDTTTTASVTTGGGMRPGAPSATTTPSTPTAATTSTPASLPPPTTGTSTSSAPSTPSTAAIAPTSGPQDDSCDDLVKLEPAAMMGQLRTGQAKCLEGRVGGESQQTTKDKVSRLLIANAENKGDKGEWERLIKRHLEDIDRSDPDLCFKYALHLSRGGVSRAQGVIRWADYALDNKSKWSGTTYKQRVFNLYKLRAEAANKLWQDADEDYAKGERTDEKEAKAAKFRGQAKDFSREWLDYAKVSGQDTKTAMALCVSSAGNRAFCEGG